MKIKLILVILCYLMIVLSCTNSVNSAISNSNRLYVYNTESINGGFQKLEFNYNKIIFNDNFIDGNLNNIKYNNHLITIKNCNDLNKYDLREIRNIVTSDRTILLHRKRSCKFIQKLQQKIQSRNYQLISTNNVSNEILSQNKIGNILKSIKENPNLFNCSKYNNSINIYCENKLQNILIKPVMSSSDEIIYFVESGYAKMKDIYLVTINNDKVITIPQYK